MSTPSRVASPGDRSAHVGYVEDVDDVKKGVCVMAPSPLLTVTVELGDGEDPEIHVHAGGQGLWIANMLTALDIRAVVCAPLGGELGALLASVLVDESFDLRRVPTEGSNGCYVEDRRSGDLECLAEMPATRLNRHESDELSNTVLTAGMETGVAVLTGSGGMPVIDADFYRRAASDLSSLGITVIGDLSGDILDAAVEGGLDVVKVADDEIGAKDPVRAAQELSDQVRHAVVLTRADEPALVFGGEVRSIQVPSLETVDHRGAGDSMTAGIAAALARGDSFDAALRLGAASGAVNVTRHGLASGRRDTIEKLAEQVTIEPASEEDLRRARAGHQ
jgi:1-phosphofructokinase